MEFERKKDIEIKGFVSGGTQYDLDIELPEDNREAIFGTIKDSYGDPISDAVVKLIEVKKDFVKKGFTQKDIDLVIQKIPEIFAIVLKERVIEQ